MSIQGKKITLHDMTLRDGMHPKQHQMTLAQMKSIAQGLDAAGMPLIEVTHGDGLGGASVNYGFPAHSDEEYLSAVIPLMKQAKVSALLLPGIGTVDHLKMARELGVHTIRVATHCTEADVSEQHITMARKMDMDTVGFLMMAHMNSAEGLVKQARLMEGYGANCIYVTDSAGYLLPDQVKERIAAVPNVLAAPAVDVEILEFNLVGPVLAVRPYCHNDHYWQVYFDTNKVIRETLGAPEFPAPTPSQVVFVKQ